MASEDNDITVLFIGIAVGAIGTYAVNFWFYSDIISRQEEIPILWQFCLVFGKSAYTAAPWIIGSAGLMLFAWVFYDQHGKRIRKAKAEVESIITAANNHEAQVKHRIKHWEEMLQRRDAAGEATLAKKRKNDLIELQALRRKLKKAEIIISNPGRVKRKYKLLWKGVEAAIESEAITKKLLL